MTHIPNQDLLSTNDKWMEQPLEPVYIQSLFPLRCNYHVACTEARSSETDMIKVFHFNLTKQEMIAHAHPVEPGCILSDKHGTYECLAVTYGKMPKVPIAIARPIFRIDSPEIGKRFIIPTFLDEQAHIRDRFILYRKWFSLPVEKVSIESVIFKKGQHDIRWTTARSSGNDMFKFFQIENTRKDFLAIHYPLEPGCIIRDKTGTYKCLSLFFPSRPIYPLFITQKID